MQIRLLFSLKSRVPCATERQCLVLKAVTQSCWRTENHRSNSLFHDLAVRFDRISVRLVAVFVRDLDIAYVHDLLRMIELSQVSFTKHQHARSLYRRSNPHPLVGFPSPTLSVHRLNLRNLFLYHNSDINNFVSVLILGNLDVLGLLVDLHLGIGFRFSARSS